MDASPESRRADEEESADRQARIDAMPEFYVVLVAKVRAEKVSDVNDDSMASALMGFYPSRDGFEVCEVSATVARPDDEPRFSGHPNPVRAAFDSTVSTFDIDDSPAQRRTYVALEVFADNDSIPTHGVDR